MSQKKFKIFVEGVTDVKFISDIISHKFNVEPKAEWFVITGGFGKLFSEKSLNQLKRIQDDEGTNLVIFDTDKSFDSIEESFEIRHNFLLNKSNESEILIKLFLFPNNQDAGDRELLLQQIANPLVYEPVAICYESYFDCLHTYNEEYQRKKGMSLSIPPQRLKRKLTLSNFLSFHDQRKDEDKRNYADTDFWDLNHPALNPLIDFLRPHFS